MNRINWFFLQLFAGEGTGDGGGEGAATGVEAADPGQQRLRELGVPEDKIQRHQARRAARQKSNPDVVRTAPATQESAPTEQNSAAAEPTTEEPKATETPARMTFKEIMEDPEYKEEMQNLIRSRLRSAKDAEENLGKLAPALELMARRHNLDPNNLDYDALAAAINNDDSFYEDKALEMGTSVDVAKKLDQQERETARMQRQQALNLEQQKHLNHLKGLEQQAEALRKNGFPNFDLRQELRNPVFARMTSPNVGISVEDAFHAIHRKEIQNAAAKATAEATARKISNDIQSGMNRPKESGTSSQAPSVGTFDYKNMSREERAALKDRIRRAKAEGRKIYPGQ